MTTNHEILESLFPMPEFRPGQEEIFSKASAAFEKGYKFFVVQAPVGIGKSPIGFAELQYFASGYYLTTQKILMDQLVRDFGKEGRWLGGLIPLVELKGRNAYECLHAKHNFLRANPKAKESEVPYTSCGNDAPCVEDGLSKYDECADFCLYHLQREKALRAPLTLFNFHSFVFNAGVKRRVLVVDEAHRVEGILMDLIQLTLSSDFFIEKFNFEIPRKKTAAEYQDELRKTLLPLLGNRIDELRKERPINVDELEKIQDCHGRLVRFLGVNPNEWVLEIRDKKNDDITDDIDALIADVQGVRGSKFKHKDFTVVLSPVIVADFAEKYLFQFADHVLLMSGTILDLGSFLKGIGIKLENPDEQFISVPTIFPVKNRRIVKRYAAKTAFNVTDDCIKNRKYVSTTKWPQLTKMIDAIANEHPNERGILHAHSFNMAEFIYANVSPKTRDRILYQGKKYNKNRAVFDEGKDFRGDREALLLEHSKSENTIILAPAMNEGLDLHDELGRFQMICKMPWPGDSRQLQQRELIHLNETGRSFKAWLTAIAFCQALGRIVRHPNDWGITYILDYGFESFFNRHRIFLPLEVVEAVRYEEQQ